MISSAPAKTDLDTSDLVVVHPMALLATPAFGGIVRGIVAEGDTLIRGEARDGFIEVQLPTGQRGFIAAAACTPLADGSADRLSEVEVGQAISLYRHPTPGAQFIDSSRQDANVRMILPEDRVMLLGRDQAFVLIQCADGQLGYIPAAVCGAGNPEIFVPLGPIDLGWIAIGGVWFVPNWLALKNALDRFSPGVAPQPSYLELMIVLGMAAVLAWFSPRRMMARSFALGMVLGYIALYTFFV